MIPVKALADFVGACEDTCCRILTAIAEVPTESGMRTVTEAAAKAFLIHWTLTKSGIAPEYANVIIRMLSSCLDGAKGVAIADGRYVVAGPEDRVFDLVESKYVLRAAKPITLMIVFGPALWSRFVQGIRS